MYHDLKSNSNEIVDSLSLTNIIKRSKLYNLYKTTEKYIKELKSVNDDVLKDDILYYFNRLMGENKHFDNYKDLMFYIEKLYLKRERKFIENVYKIGYQVYSEKNNKNTYINLNDRLFG